MKGDRALMVADAPRVYRASEICRIARVGRDALNQAMERGEIAHKNLSGSAGVRITERALLAWLEGRPANVPELTQSAALAILACLHEGADARFVDGVLQIAHDGDPGIWHSIGIVTADAIESLEARWALIRASSASVSPGT